MEEVKLLIHLLFEKFKTPGYLFKKIWQKTTIFMPLM